MLLPLVTGTPPADSAPRDPAAASPANGAAEEWIFLRVDGPNDGELLEGRSILPLRVTTNYSEDAFLAIYAGQRFAQVEDLHPGPDADFQVAEIELDLAAHGIDPAELADEEGQLELVFYLFRASDAYLVTHTRWSVRVVHPWIEFFVPLGDEDEDEDEDDDSAEALRALVGEAISDPDTTITPHGKATEDPIMPPGTLAMQPHAPPAAQYFVVLTSDQRDVLTLFPDNPRSMAGAWPLAAGFVGRSLGAEAALPPVSLPPPSAQKRYVVLWTYSQRSGWTCSPIYRKLD